MDRQRTPGCAGALTIPRHLARVVGFSYNTPVKSCRQAVRACHAACAAPGGKTVTQRWNAGTRW